MFWRFFAIAVFTLFAVSAGFGLASFAEGEDQGFVADDSPEELPNLTITDDQGHELTLKDFKGRYVLLNLWATWCGPCTAEMPALDTLETKLDNKKFAVVALSEDRDGSAAVHGFFQRHNIAHLAVYTDGGGRAPVMLHARGLPTTILINPEGLEIARLQGEADWNKESVISYLRDRAAQ